MRSIIAGRTPEELETLMEDAIVLRDGQALSWLFEPGGLIVLGGDQRVFLGTEEIAKAVDLVSGLTGGYIAQPRRLYQSRDLVLLIGDGVINVARRGRDRSWRSAILLLDPGLGRAEGKPTGRS